MKEKKKSFCGGFKNTQKGNNDKCSWFTQLIFKKWKKKKSQWEDHTVNLNIEIGWFKLSYKGEPRSQGTWEEFKGKNTEEKLSNSLSCSCLDFL